MRALGIAAPTRLDLIGVLAYGWSMMKTTRNVAVILLVFMAAACTSEKLEVLKSPCVGLEGSPCGPKRPVNGAFNPQLHPEPMAEKV